MDGVNSAQKRQKAPHVGRQYPRLNELLNLRPSLTLAERIKKLTGIGHMHQELRCAPDALPAEAILDTGLQVPGL